MPELVVSEAKSAVEIDKHARRQLRLSIAEAELERIQVRG